MHEKPEMILQEKLEISQKKCLHLAEVEKLFVYLDESTLNINDYLATDSIFYIRANPPPLLETHTVGPPRMCSFPIILYINDYNSTQDRCPIIRFADDAALVGMVQNNHTVCCRSAIHPFSL